jgi:hypothetical protein
MELFSFARIFISAGFMNLSSLFVIWINFGSSFNVGKFEDVPVFPDRFPFISVLGIGIMAVTGGVLATGDVLGCEVGRVAAGGVLVTGDVLGCKVGRVEIFFTGSNGPPCGPPLMGRIPERGKTAEGF